MTILTEIRSATLAGNDSARIFPFSFRVFSEEHVSVTLIDAEGTAVVLNPALYSVALSQNGGTITYPVNGSPLPTGSSIIIERSVPIVQQTDLTNQGPFFAQSHEDVFDYLTMIAQQQNDVIGRTVQAPKGESGIVLPPVQRRSGKIFSFDMDGAPEAVITTSSVTALSGLTAEIATVAGIADDIMVVADNDIDISMVAGMADQIQTVADGSALPTDFSVITNKPTTLAGFGITDAQEGLSGTQGQRVGFDADGNPIAEDVPEVITSIQARFSPINFPAAMSDVRSFHAYTLLKTGVPGANNVTQSFVEDEVHGFVYTLHVQNSSDEAAYVLKYNKLEGRNLTPSRVSSGSQVVGHQGFGIEYRPSGPTKYWSSANDSVTDSQNYAVRFEANDDPNNAGALIIENTQLFKLFPGNLGPGNTTPTVSWDGSLLVAEQAGDTTGSIRVFTLKTLVDGGPGDYSEDTSAFTSFPISQVFSVNRRIQDLECDGQFIYLLVSSSSSIDAKVAKYKVDGELVDIFDIRAGAGLASGDGAGTHYEPEGFCKVIVDGQIRLGLLVASGDVGARVNRVLYLDTSTGATVWFDDLTIEDATTGGNVGPQTFPTRFTQSGKNIHFTAIFQNAVTTGLNPNSNVYFRGFSKLPLTDTALSISTSVISWDSDTIFAAAVLDSSANGYCRIQESKSGTGSATTNVSAIASGSGDIIISGTYSVA